MQDKKKNSFFRQKLRLTVMVEKSYEELISLKFTPFSMFFGLSAIIIILIGLVTVLIAFTDLREYIPGYPTGAERRMIMQNLERADSLALEIELRDAVLNDLRAALSGNLPIEAFSQDSIKQMRADNKIKLDAKLSTAEREFRESIETDSEFNLDANQNTLVDTDNLQLELMYFFTPMKGIITDHFGSSPDHFGVDVANAEGTRVSSVLEGTVIFAEWTLQTGYVIQVQHSNQLISVYKHNSKLLKRVGDRVESGEAIALLGNSGEYTTGVHLHFELWYNGVALNPEDYIAFE